MTAAGIWLVFLLLGVALLLAGSTSSAVRLVAEIRDRERLKSAPVKETANLGAILPKWEIFVLGKRGTVREVKRFANRARFLTTLHPFMTDEAHADAFVGLVALDQCGLLPLPVEDETRFEEWRRALSSDKSLPEGWLQDLRIAQVVDYSRVVAVP